jgi:hypothetical protein
VSTPLPPLVRIARPMRADGRGLSVRRKPTGSIPRLARDTAISPEPPRSSSPVHSPPIAALALVPAYSRRATSARPLGTENCRPAWSNVAATCAQRA